MHRLQKGLNGLLLVALLPLGLNAQKDTPIYFVNPSFEDLPKCCETPTGWYNCGKSEESPPDIQPGSFQVTKAPSHGETYLGLVVRDNDTWEGVSQRLSRPLEANQCYEFSLDLCRAELYLSMSKTTGEEANYTIPAKLRIYGGNGLCERRELLYETPEIKNNRWLTYNFRLTPKNGTYSYILIEAYFKQPILFPYNGNILVDNATSIKTLPCNPDVMPEAKQASTPTKTPTTRTGTTTKPPTTTSKPDTGAKKPEPTKTATTKTDFKNLKKGDIVRLDKVYFEANKYDLKEESLPALEEVLTFLKSNPGVIVEIGGHTNNNPSDAFANQLSTDRAKAVSEWLIARGISPERVQYKGYGKKNPIEPNTTPEGRKKNQRVEIKILST